MRHDHARLAAFGAVSVLSLTLGATSAFAGAFGLREQSAVGQGSSFAGAAAGAAGLGSMFWNPATMTNFPGYQIEAGIAGIVPHTTMKTTAGSNPVFSGASTGDIGQDAFVPSSYGSAQILPDLWVGVGVNAPFGLSTKPDASWTPRTVYGSTTEVFSTGITPTIAYRINDRLSIGAGVQILYFKATYWSTGSAGPIAGKNVGIQGDSWGWGGTVGATWKPMAGTELGIGFRSAVQQDLEGVYRTVGDTPINMRIVLPEQLTVGLRQRINEQWDVLAGVEWTNWSRLNVPRFTSAATGAKLGDVPLGYKDGWYFPLGAEYRFNRDLTLRAGLAYEMSPIDTSSRSTRLPDNDRLWASAGGSYKWNEQLSFDVGYTHIFVRDTKLRLDAGNPVYDYSTANPKRALYGEVDGSVDILSVGLRYRFDTPARAALPQSAPRAVK